MLERERLACHETGWSVGFKVCSPRGQLLQDDSGKALYSCKPKYAPRGRAGLRSPFVLSSPRTAHTSCCARCGASSSALHRSPRAAGQQDEFVNRCRWQDQTESQRGTTHVTVRWSAEGVRQSTLRPYNEVFQLVKDVRSRAPSSATGQSCSATGHEEARATAVAGVAFIPFGQCDIQRGVQSTRPMEHGPHRHWGRGGGAARPRHRTRTGGMAAEPIWCSPVDVASVQ